MDGLTADIKRLNRQTRPHTPGPARMECRRFHPGSSTKPWGVPQGQRGRNRGRNQTEDSNPSPSPRYIEFPGQSVIFPIAVAEVWEFDRSPSWRVFCYSAISDGSNQGRKAQRINTVGPFAFCGEGAESGAACRCPARIGRRGGRNHAMFRAKRGTRPVPGLRHFTVDKPGILRVQTEPSHPVRPRRQGSDRIVHTDALLRIVNPPDPFPHRIHFFNPKTARAKHKVPLSLSSLSPSGRGTNKKVPPFPSSFPPAGARTNIRFPTPGLAPSGRGAG